MQQAVESRKYTFTCARYLAIMGFLYPKGIRGRLSFSQVRDEPFVAEEVFSADLQIFRLDEQ